MTKDEALDMIAQLQIAEQAIESACKRIEELKAENKILKESQRTWVGLTDDEIDQGLLRSDYAFKTAEAWRAGVVFAMTKLKEKNNE